MTKQKTYNYAMKEAVVGRRAPNIKKDDDGNSEDGIMKMGFRKKISEVGKVGAVIKFFFSNAGLVYACIIYAVIGLFFSRESDSTITSVRSFVYQSVCKTPQQLEIIILHHSSFILHHTSFILHHSSFILPSFRDF